jgi:hypothetical protein
MLNPDMPVQELKLHMGELTPEEERTARAAIRWANSQAAGVRPTIFDPEHYPEDALREKAAKFDRIEALINRLERPDNLHTAMDDTLEMLDGVVEIVKGLVPDEVTGHYAPPEEARQSLVFNLLDPDQREALLEAAEKLGLTVKLDGDTIVVLATPAEARALGLAHVLAATGVPMEMVGAGPCPRCGTPLALATGSGWFCPNPRCSK